MYDDYYFLFKYFMKDGEEKYMKHDTHHINYERYILYSVY